MACFRLWEEPSEDPMSGAALSIDESAQYQDGIVDSELDRPLRAFLRDVDGRPVNGALVTFAVITGTGALIDGNGIRVQHAAYPTDRHGVATARFVFGEQQGAFGHYRAIQNEPYPQWLGTNSIEVRADSSVGPLYSGEPYLVFAWPQSAAELLLQGASGPVLHPGLGYSVHLASVRDPFGNAISNANVTLGATTRFNDSTCWISSEVQQVAATLFESGQCPEDELLLTGNACAAPTLEVTTRPDGAPFFVIPPNLALSDVDVTGASGAADASLHLATDPIYDPCRGLDVTGMIAWTRTPTFGLIPLFGAYTPPIDAAPPNQPLPLPQRMDAYYATTLSGPYAEVRWFPVTDATFVAELLNGSLDSVQNIGGEAIS